MYHLEILKLENLLIEWYWFSKKYKKKINLIIFFITILSEKQKYINKFIH